MTRSSTRSAALGLSLVLGACNANPTWTPAMGWFAAVDAGTVVVAGRTLGDTVVSLVSGRDCSVVRVARQESYCAPREAPPEPPPFCTRTLGGVDCWATPPVAWPPVRGLADGRYELTPAQEANRTRRWPGLF